MEREKRVLFVTEMRAVLIQRVSIVEPLADHLLQNGHIHQETYKRICRGRTTQDKMRELYNVLNTKASKVAFYEALMETDPSLLEELEKSYQAAVPQQEDGGTEKYRKLWVRRSVRYRETFEELLRDPEYKELKNPKILFCTKSEYKIGSGAEGTQVYIGIRYDGTEVAVKRMLKDNHEKLNDEMKLLRNLDHKNIVRYLDFTHDQDFHYLCLQICEYNLEQYMEKKLDQEASKKLVKEVLLGLEYLHDEKIIHRDIKPANILIDVEGNVRLADFGISRTINQAASYVYTTRAGTRGWEATEILNGGGKVQYRTSTDIQVAGMLVYYIISGGFHPFGDDNTEDNIRKEVYHLDRITDVEAKDLIKKMIAHNPEDRLSVTQAVEHPYFWNDDGKEAFLRTIGDVDPVQKYTSVDEKLRKTLEKYPQFCGWKAKMSEYVPKKIPADLPDDLLGLLRFLRNQVVHAKKTFNECKGLFPEFYVYANQLAIEMGWKRQRQLGESRD
ncbi:serine/threonine-protein kinase/endoribonuclease IRE1-like [Tachysurus vachellii]|uniref:serine/threonine-protein kinase/endoribonuclease IRE1-like n=1 Tax=Tachysurus vachellii TaxID=175792 RepID=UPI00296AA226|nr:serine/threonine-protein kinase/endoribonuclease IRE1-like [Tachysurus vachellii]XP_060719008.1 serine/threonine-protein kinase/endoribonuclease IRE1-like [Tachysurus vachellii]XP_060719009.1 serine/threonine-protein kinase/endoribonuclease IRE1-like [Tachysurus vachellii]XP_060719011.1 serine/threonine-protein kinase/endoribonuclease IRE1-like [Tachysurus vachellii]